MTIPPYFHELVSFEPVALFLCLVFFYRAGLSKRYPAIRNYLIFRCVASLYLMLILDSPALFQLSDKALSYWYFYSYWSCYLIGVGLIFRIARDAFNEGTRHKPLIQKTGNIVFTLVLYFGLVTCIVLSISAVIAPAQSFPRELVHLAKGAMCTVLIFELGVMGFLAVASKQFGTKIGNPLIGVMLGLGIESSAQWVLLLCEYYYNSKLWNVENYILQIVTDLIMVSWALYFHFARSEQEYEARSSSLAETPLLRWSTYATKYAQRPPAVSARPSTSFFLRDATRPGTHPSAGL